MMSSLIQGSSVIITKMMMLVSEKVNHEDEDLAEKDGVTDGLADLLVKVAVPRHPQPLLVQLAADDDLREHVLRRPRLVLQ